MARTPSEQRRDPAERNTARDQGLPGQCGSQPGPKETGTKGPARQQPGSRRARPFAPGEDGESH